MDGADLMARGVIAHARVTLTIEVPASGCWGAGTALDQVYRQAGEETKRLIEDMLTKRGGKVIGEPKVVAVMAYED